MLSDMTVLGSGFLPKQLPAEPTPADTTLEILHALMLLREGLANLPAPVVTVSPQDLSDVVQAVQGLNGPHGPSPQDIAAAVRAELMPVLDQPVSEPEWTKALLKALENLDFRLRAPQVSGGGPGSVTVNNTADNPVPVTGSLTSNGLTDAELRATPVPVSGTVTTGGLTDTQLRASAVSVQDLFTTGEILADQTGAGAVLTFTFANPMDLIWVRDTGAVTTNVSRADPFGGTPTASLGIPVPNGEPTPITVTASSVKVFAPTGSTISVVGYRK